MPSHSFPPTLVTQYLTPLLPPGVTFHSHSSSKFSYSSFEIRLAPWPAVPWPTRWIVPSLSVTQPGGGGPSLPSVKSLSESVTGSAASKEPAAKKVKRRSFDFMFFWGLGFCFEQPA